MFHIYSKPGCPNCEKAKMLLKMKDMLFEEHILDVGQPKDPNVSYYTTTQLQTLVPNARTVPQIFEQVGDTSELIGGYEALNKKLSVK
jgi:glutaredoxin